MSDNNWLINNHDLDTINSLLNRFNPIKLMKMEESEIKHSNILRWLLDPKENHGLGDLFLTRFLAESFSNIENEKVEHALKYNIRNKNIINPVNIVKESLYNSIVNTEYTTKDKSGFIDIFIECPDQKWVFIIENKINAKLSKNQLSKYYESIQNEKKYKDYNIGGIFLTIDGEDPNEQSNQELAEWSKKSKKYIYTGSVNKKKFPYVSLTHQDSIQQLKNILELQDENLSPRVKNFMKYYIDVIEEKYNENDFIDTAFELARKISKENKKKLEQINNIRKLKSGNKSEELMLLYHENKKALDFILDNVSLNSFAHTIDEVCGENVKKGDVFEVDGFKFIFLKSTNKSFDCVPFDWYYAFADVEKDEKYDIDKCKNSLKTWTKESYQKNLARVLYYPIYFRVEIKRDSPNLRSFAEIGPVIERQLLNNFIADKNDSNADEHKKKYITAKKNSGSSNNEKTYTRITNTRIFNSDNIKVPEDENKKIKYYIEKSVTLLKKFMKTAEPVIHEGIKKWVKEMNKNAKTQ